MQQKMKEDVVEYLLRKENCLEDLYKVSKRPVKDFDNLHNFRGRAIDELYVLGFDNDADRMKFRRSNCVSTEVKRIYCEMREIVGEEDNVVNDMFKEIILRDENRRFAQERWNKWYEILKVKGVIF